MAGKRRKHGEGTIYQRADGRWSAQLTLEGGERKTLYGKTSQEVQRKLTAAKRDRDLGMPAVGERLTVRQYLDDWLANAKPTIRAGTLRRYTDYVHHALPMLGAVKLARLTPHQLQRLYAAKLADGLSPTTVRALHTVLHTALKAALRLGLVQRNVAELVTPPRPARQKTIAYTPEQVGTLLQAVAGDRFEAMYVLAVTTGVRLGEALGLHWRDVDLDARQLAVRESLQLAPEGLVFNEPKTASSRRQVALTALAVDALRRHRTRQLEERLARGAAWNEQDLVFPNTKGGPMYATNFRRLCFYPLLRRAGLPRIRFHDLRHTAATLMLLQRVPTKVVSEMLGHASVSITSDLYSHVLPDMQADATRAMDALTARLLEPNNEGVQ